MMHFLKPFPIIIGVFMILLLIYGTEKTNETVPIKNITPLNYSDYYNLPINQEDAKRDIFWWENGDCVCDAEKGCLPRKPWQNNIIPHRLSESYGTCSRKAALDGYNQKVISYSLFGSSNGYYIGLPEILETITNLYPGWKVWIYTNPRTRSNILCPLLMKFDQLRICDVTNLPAPLFNLTNVQNMLWRISPLGDPHVNAFLSRDTDSMILPRGRAAVEEWLQSGKMFHVMRDHPGHRKNMMGGMWGAQNWNKDHLNHSLSEENITTVSPVAIPPSANRLNDLKMEIFNKARNRMGYNVDQGLLQTVLFPIARYFLVSHDSFSCKKRKDGWRPFPTKRDGNKFLGQAWYRNGARAHNAPYPYTCPEECRPPNHQDWTAC